MAADELDQLKQQMLQNVKLEHDECYRVCKEVMFEQMTEQPENFARLAYVEGHTSTGQGWIPHAWLVLDGVEFPRFRGQHDYAASAVGCVA